jgi:hypothetical protein
VAMDMQEYTYYNTVNHQGRQLAKTQNGLLLALKAAFKLLVFFPLVVTGYWITTKLLTRQSEGILWIIIPIGMAIVLYGVLIALRSFIIAKKQKGQLIWLPVFILCVLFSCVLPVYVAYQPINQLTSRMQGGTIITYIILLIFGMYIYSRYDYLGHFSKKGKI